MGITWERIREYSQQPPAVEESYDPYGNLVRTL